MPNPNTKITFEQYVNAIFAKLNNGNYELPKQQMNEISQHIVEELIFREYCVDADISEVTASSVKFIKNRGGKFKNKTTIGVKEIDDTQYDAAEIYFDQPKYISEGFLAADVALGLPYSAAKKMIKYANQSKNIHEEKGFSRFEEYISKNPDQIIKFDFSKATPLEIYAKVQNLGTKIRLLKNWDEGIDKVSRSQILISIEPFIFDKLSQSGLVGNRVDITFSGGQYSIGLVGGYRVISNPYLAKYKVIGGTTFSGGQGFKVIASNVGRVGQTNDIGMYYEWASAAGIVFKSTLFGIEQEETKKDNDQEEVYSDKSKKILEKNSKLNEVIEKLKADNNFLKKDLKEISEKFNKANEKIEILNDEIFEIKKNENENKEQKNDPKKNLQNNQNDKG